MEWGLPISAWLEKKLATPVDPGGGVGINVGPKVNIAVAQTGVSSLVTGNAAAVTGPPTR